MHACSMSLILANLKLCFGMAPAPWGSSHSSNWQFLAGVKKQMRCTCASNTHTHMQCVHAHARQLMRHTRTYMHSPAHFYHRTTLPHLRNKLRAEHSKSRMAIIWCSMRWCDRSQMVPVQSDLVTVVVRAVLSVCRLQLPTRDEVAFSYLSGVAHGVD